MEGYLEVDTQRTCIAIGPSSRSVLLLRVEYGSVPLRWDKDNTQHTTSLCAEGGPFPLRPHMAVSLRPRPFLRIAAWLSYCAEPQSRTRLRVSAVRFLFRMSNAHTYSVSICRCIFPCPSRSIDDSLHRSRSSTLMRYFSRLRMILRPGGWHRHKNERPNVVNRCVWWSAR